MTRRVVVTGTSVVTALGTDTSEFWDRLCAGKSGVSPLERFDCSEFKVRFGGEIKDFDPTDCIPAREVKRLDRFCQFALYGAVKAVQQAAAACGSSAPVTPTGGHNSDSVSFLAAGIPAVTLMTGAWLNQNHTPEDTPAMINTAQLSLASEIMYRAVKTLAF